MRYICGDCGEVFDESEIITRYEHYEAWGKPFKETYDCCPRCYGLALLEFGEAKNEEDYETD